MSALSPDETSGALSKGAVPRLLREIYVGRRSGWLRLVRRDERQSLRFRRGHIINAHTNIQAERLGEMMVRRGMLSEADLARATEIVIRDKRRLGEVLSDLGLVDASTLEDAVAMHVHEMLCRVFEWTEGSHSFESEDDVPTGELTLKLSTGELILNAVRALHDPGVVRDALGDEDRVLELSSDPLLRFQKLTLSPVDGFVFSRVDGITSVREIIQMIPLPSEDTEKSLLGLLATGVIELASGRRRPSSPAAARAAQDSPASGPAPAAEAQHAAAVVPPLEPQPTPADTAPPPAPQPEPPTAAEDTAEARRREIVEMAEGLQSRNHFEILGIPVTASEIDVKEAYFRLARRFHPDAHHDASLGDLHETLETLFIQLGQVYDVLKDPKRRAEYVERMAHSRTPSTAHPESPPAAPAASPEEEELDSSDADIIIRNAGIQFEKEKYWDAIQLLEPIVRRAQGLQQMRVRILLARCYLKNPKWARRAEEMLLEVTRAEPRAVEAWALLGGIYDAKGMRTRALNMFRKALELNPQHEEAADYVASHQPQEEAAPPEKSRGLLGRLFRKP